MSDLVDRQTVINAIENVPGDERFTGHWLKTCSPCGDGKAYECFSCGSDVRECEAENYSFCPYCGSWMYGIKEVEDE